ncbi:MAG: glycerol acyltransferase [Desulfobacterales bacterium]|nr:glycerol acyltransferase [Desulfobacterales bacterium]
MKKITIYNTPVINTLARYFSRFVMKLMGWSIGEIPKDMESKKKYVLIAAPHTSNWDFVITLFAAFALKMKVSVMIKNDYVKKPFGFFFIWLGVIPIDRSKSSNMVEKSIEQFKKKENLILIVPPSGTRKKIAYWKTGFYHIADGAKVPIGLGYLDYETKTAGIGPFFHTTGDIKKDMVGIQNFYADKTGKYPEKQLKIENN